jgi:hypothetical protein
MARTPSWPCKWISSRRDFSLPKIGLRPTTPHLPDRVPVCRQFSAELVDTRLRDQRPKYSLNHLSLPVSFGDKTAIQRQNCGAVKKSDGLQYFSSYCPIERGTIPKVKTCLNICVFDLETWRVNFGDREMHPRRSTVTGNGEGCR